LPAQPRSGLLPLYLDNVDHLDLRYGAEPSGGQPPAVTPGLRGCDAAHGGNSFHIVDMIAVCFLSLPHNQASIQLHPATLDGESRRYPMKRILLLAAGALGTAGMVPPSTPSTATTGGENK
jgi:hypothetical protein